jgi:hypothetical protein
MILSVVCLVLGFACMCIENDIVLNLFGILWLLSGSFLGVIANESKKLNDKKSV